MGIDLRIPKWSTTDSKQHVSTTWEIHSNALYTDILDSSVQNTVDKIYWTSAMQLPEGVTWYARSKMYFNDGSDSDWVNSTTIDHSKIIDYNARNKQYVVEKPIVTSNSITAINDAYPTLDISCSDFRCLDTDTRLPTHNNTHVSTCWMVLGSNDTLLYFKLYDSVNKTSISIPKTSIEKYGDQAYIRIAVIFVDDNGLESEIGKCDIFNILTGSNAITTPTYAVIGDINSGVGSSFVFTAESKLSPPKTIVKYKISWGDNSPDTYSDDGTETHTYSGIPGTTFHQCVVAVDELGNESDKKCTDVVLGSTWNGSVIITEPTSIYKDKADSYTVSGISSKLNPPSNVLTYNYDWGDGNTQSSTNPVEQHTYTGVSGTNYVIKVTATDAVGNISPIGTKNITVSEAHVDTPVLTVDGSPSDIPEQAVLHIGSLPNVIGTNTPITGLNWRVLKASDDSVVYSVTTPPTTLTITLPANKLIANTQYKFGVQAFITT